VQVFFRGADGIRRFREIAGHTNLSGNDRGLPPLLEYAARLRNRKRDIQKEMPVWGENPSLKTELDLVEAELARIGALLEAELKRARQQVRQMKEGDDD